MKIKSLRFVLTSTLLCLLSFQNANAALSAQHTVTMKSISFEPRNLEIHVNDSVIWENASYTDHSAKADDGTFETGFVHPKQKSKPIVFSKAGTFLYHCAMHGKAMGGTIVVTP